MLFKREIRRNFKSFLIITLISSFMVYYIIAMGKSFGTDLQQILDMKLPPNMQKAFGMEGLDFTLPNSFFALTFSYVYLFFSIYIAGVFAIIVSKEFSEKTAEFLFSLPAKRMQFITSKLLAAGLYAILWAVVVFLSAWASFEINIGGGYDINLIVVMTLAWLIGGITFAALSFMLSSFFTRSRTISAISIGLVMGMFMLQLVISFNTSLSFLKYISPFDWFKGSEIAETGELSMVYCLIAAGTSIICFWMGIHRFKKMDVLI